MSLYYIALLVGVISVSSASILVRLSSAGPLVIAFYRLAFSVLMLGLPIAWNKRAKISSRDKWLSMVSGALLAAHFTAWFYSLKLTSIASSTILVDTHPFVVLAIGYVRRGERTKGVALAGVCLSIVGVALVGWGDFGFGQDAFIGDCLALIGAIAVAGYFLVGREVRRRVDAIHYSAMAYAVASLLLLVAAIATRSPLTGFAPANWWIFVALALFPTLLGHTVFNWALKYVPASVVSVNILAEPIGATLLAWMIWRTAPNGLSLAGGIAVLAGIALFLRFHQAD